MRFIPSLALCALTVGALPSLAAPQEAVVAEPNVLTAGQTVTLRWYFTGRKVVVSGGRFGKGMVVTGKQRLTDTPKTTTRYTFDAWYPDVGTGEAVTPKTKILHARYTVLVQVQPAPNFALYRDPHGWQIGYQKGWKRDNVPLADPANNALMYFQPEDDSVERLAVSILPAEKMESGDLLEKVKKSLPSSYAELEVLSETETKLGEVPALLLSYRGVPQSNPESRTQSVVLVFVRAGRAYVVSARTAASRFQARRPVLEQMIRSFAFTGKAASQ